MTAASAEPRDAARIFYSGHSLMDQPLPNDVAAIAESLGTPAKWNRHYMWGTAIRTRARGPDLPDQGWAGYRWGYNREGQGMDVIAEFRNPQTIGGERYDALLITEQHGLLGTLVWNDTVRYLRHYHDRFIEGNAQGQTWFYEAWLSIDDKSDPRRWIAYERAASPVWQCLATRINVSLAAEKRSDRIASLPAGLALAALIERATQGTGLPGITAPTVRETVDRIVKDDVHLTPLGAYYMALVSYATIYVRSPVGAWAPKDVNVNQAKALQEMAWSFVTDYRANNRPLDLAACRALLSKSFIGLYWGYTRDTFWAKDLDPARAWVRWAKHMIQWHWRFRGDNADNPLHFDPTNDRSYWLPAP